MIVLAYDRLELVIDEKDGQWLTLGWRNSPSGNVLGSKGHVFEVYLEDKAIFGQERCLTDVQVHASAASASLTYERAGIRAVQTIVLEADHLCHTIALECTAGGDRLLTEIRYTLPGFSVGDPPDCLLQLPGQMLPPDSSYAAEALKPLDLAASEPHPDYPQGWLESAPDQTSGLIAVENRSLGRIASAWLYSDKAVVFPTVDGQGTRITAEHRHKLTAWLRPGDAVKAGTHCLLFTEGTLESHLKRFRDVAYTSRLEQAEDKAQWLADARLLQIDPRPLAYWRSRLDHYWKLGFNTLYLLPVWSNTGNPYSLIDHYRIDDDTSRAEEWSAYPEGICEIWDDNPFPVGSTEELKDFVKEAHERGYRVLFDLIPQGIHATGTFAKEHQKWLVRDELGRPHASHGWGPRAGEPEFGGGTHSMDWGNPEYREFIVNWALWNVETFDIDGFRTDAMHWKEANRYPGLGRPAWETTFGGVRLIEELRPRLKALKPDAVLLSEVWGPIFQRGHDATYENGWLLGRLNTGWLTEKPAMTGAQWSRHLALAALCRPEGLTRAIFGANHDLEVFVRLAKTHTLGNAVQFTHIFSDGIPFVWYKEVERREEIFRDMLRERERLTGYSCSHGEIESSSTHVFTSLWRSAGGFVLAAANLSKEAVVSALNLADSGEWRSLNLRFGAFGAAAEIQEGRALLHLPPGGYALFDVISFLL